MMNRKSKWGIYIASYLPLFVILILRLLFDNASSVQINWTSNKALIIVLVTLVMLSLFCIISISRIKPTERTYAKIKENRSYEMITFVLPYFISLITFNLDWYGWLIMGCFLIVMGCIIVKSDLLRMCPAFFIARYFLFIDENGKYILSRKSKEEINLFLDEHTNGIEIKPLATNLYIMKT